MTKTPVETTVILKAVFKTKKGTNYYKKPKLQCLKLYQNTAIS